MDDQLQVQDLNGPKTRPCAEGDLFPVCNKNRTIINYANFKALGQDGCNDGSSPAVVYDALSPGSNFDDGDSIQ